MDQIMLGFLDHTLVRIGMDANEGYRIQENTEIPAHPSIERMTTSGGINAGVAATAYLRELHQEPENSRNS